MTLQKFWILTLVSTVWACAACHQMDMPEGEADKAKTTAMGESSSIGEAASAGGVQFASPEGMPMVGVVLNVKTAETLPASELARQLVRRMGKQPLDAARRYKLVYGHAPVEISDFAPFAFTWPALPQGDSIVPIPLLEDGAALNAVQSASLEKVLSQPESLPYHLSLSGDELVIQYPSASPADKQLGVKVWHRPIYTAAEVNPGWDEQYFNTVPLATLNNAVDAPDLHRRLLFYRSRAEDLADARVGEAADQLLALLESVTSQYQASFTDWESVARLRAVSTINLTPSEIPEDADIVLESNGRDAYRLRVRYPSGYTEDTAVVSMKMAGTLGSRPLRGDQHDWGTEPLHLLLAVDVVPIESALLPRA